MTRDRDQIDELTHCMRTGSDLLRARLRTLLRERGVDTDKSLLTRFFLDDGALYFGIVVTQDTRAIQFDLDVLRRPVEEGILSQWRDITEAHTPHLGIVEAGLFRLEREGGSIL
jgi:hypothetical protein